MASYYGYPEIIEILLMEGKYYIMFEGFNVNEPGNVGNTPIHYAASQNHKDAIEILVRNGADVHKKRDDGKIRIFN